MNYFSSDSTEREGGRERENHGKKVKPFLSFISCMNLINHIIAIWSILLENIQSTRLAGDGGGGCGNSLDEYLWWILYSSAWHGVIFKALHRRFNTFGSLMNYVYTNYTIKSREWCEKWQYNINSKRFSMKRHPFWLDSAFSQFELV